MKNLIYRFALVFLCSVFTVSLYSEYRFDAVSAWSNGNCETQLLFSIVGDSPPYTVQITHALSGEVVFNEILETSNSKIVDTHLFGSFDILIVDGIGCEWTKEANGVCDCPDVEYEIELPDCEGFPYAGSQENNYATLKFNLGVGVVLSNVSIGNNSYPSAIQEIAGLDEGEYVVVFDISYPDGQVGYLNCTDQSLSFIIEGCECVLEAKNWGGIEISNCTPLQDYELDILTYFEDYGRGDATASLYDNISGQLIDESNFEIGQERGVFVLDLEYGDSYRIDLIDGKGCSKSNYVTTKSYLAQNYMPYVIERYKACENGTGRVILGCIKARDALGDDAYVLRTSAGKVEYIGGRYLEEGSARFEYRYEVRGLPVGEHWAEFIDQDHETDCRGIIEFVVEQKTDASVPLGYEMYPKSVISEYQQPICRRDVMIMKLVVPSWARNGNAVIKVYEDGEYIKLFINQTEYVDHYLDRNYRYEIEDECDKLILQDPHLDYSCRIIQVENYILNDDTNGNEEGSINITSVSQACNSPLTYEWSTGENGPNIQNLSAGQYKVTITNAKGCELTKSFTVLNCTSGSSNIDFYQLLIADHDPTSCIGGGARIELEYKSEDLEGFFERIRLVKHPGNPFTVIETIEKGESFIFENIPEGDYFIQGLNNADGNCEWKTAMDWVSVKCSECTDVSQLVSIEAHDACYESFSFDNPFGFLGDARFEIKVNEGDVDLLGQCDIIVQWELYENSNLENTGEVKIKLIKYENQNLDVKFYGDKTIDFSGEARRTLKIKVFESCTGCAYASEATIDSKVPICYPEIARLNLFTNIDPINYSVNDFVDFGYRGDEYCGNYHHDQINNGEIQSYKFIPDNSNNVCNSGGKLLYKCGDYERVIRIPARSSEKHTFYETLNDEFEIWDCSEPSSFCLFDLFDNQHFFFNYLLLAEVCEEDEIEELDCNIDYEYISDKGTGIVNINLTEFSSVEFKVFDSEKFEVLSRRFFGKKIQLDLTEETFLHGEYIIELHKGDEICRISKYTKIEEPFCEPEFCQYFDEATQEIVVNQVCFNQFGEPEILEQYVQIEGPYNYLECSSFEENPEWLLEAVYPIQACHNVKFRFNILHPPPDEEIVVGLFKKNGGDCTCNRSFDEAELLASAIPTDSGEINIEVDVTELDPVIYCAQAMYLRSYNCFDSPIFKLDCFENPDPDPPAEGCAIDIDSDETLDFDTLTYFSSLASGFVPPVLMTGSLSTNDMEVSSTAVRNVNSDNFEFALNEFNYQDKIHGEEQVAYFAADPGVYDLGGLTMQAGNAHMINHDLSYVEFAQPFQSVPVIMATQTTMNDLTPTILQIHQVTPLGFMVRIAEEEAEDGVHMPESISYLAFQAGIGDINGKTLVVGRSETGVDHNGLQIPFNNTGGSLGGATGASPFETSPLVFAMPQTMDGEDPAVVRYEDLTADGMTLKMHEEQSLDTEIEHPPVSVGYVLIESGDGCECSAEFEIIEESILNATCGNEDGAISFQVEGGTPPYQFDWSTGDQDSGTSTTLSNLGFGEYSVTVLDADSCYLYNEFKVFEVEGLDVSNSIVEHPSCQGNTGFIQVVPHGGNLPYTYNWNTGAQTSSITNLGKGTYKVTVTDASGGCSIIHTYYLDKLRLVSSAHKSAYKEIDALCGMNNGAIVGGPYGGKPPYSYAWDDGVNTKERYNLAPGTYRLTVTASDGCTKTKTFRIEDVDELDIVNSGGNDGFIYSQEFSESTTLYWSFVPEWVSDQLIIKTDNLELLNTGLVTQKSSCFCDGHASCSCSDLFMGDYGGQTVDLIVGQGTISAANGTCPSNNTQPMEVEYISGSTEVPGGTPIQFMVNGQVCGPGTNTYWELMVSCTGPPSYSSNTEIYEENYEESNAVSASDLENQDEIKLYPNPTADALFLELENQSQSVDLKIMDISGRVVLIESLSLQSLYEINISNIDAGLYFVNIKVGDQIFTERIVIE